MVPLCVMWYIVTGPVEFKIVIECSKAARNRNMAVSVMAGLEFMYVVALTSVGPRKYRW